MNTGVAERHGARVAFAVALGVAVAAGIVLRLHADSDLWLDEAASVNIAKLPLSDLHEALRHDGAPPLYYVLLHFWIDAFGAGDNAVRALSTVFSVATFPALFFAGRRIGGRRVAWLAVVVLAVSPYAVQYSTETRMYALIMFLVAWGYLACVRALERPTIGRLALVALIVAALLYTHNWSLYLVAVVGALAVGRALSGRSSDRRAAAWRVVGAIVVGCVLYIPWVPTLVYQARHTGTPWGDPVVPWSGFVSHIDSLGGLGTRPHAESLVLRLVVVVLIVLGVFGAGVDRFHVDLDLRTRSATRWVAVLAYGTLVLGLVASYVGGTAFDARYSAVMVPFALLLVAAGIGTFVSDLAQACVLGTVVVLGLAGGVRFVVDNRTQAEQSASIIRTEAKPGDLVLYCPDQLGPSVHRRLHGGPPLVEVTFPRLRRPDRVDWVDYRKRIQHTDYHAFVEDVLARADGRTIWYVESPGYRRFVGRCERIDQLLGAARPVHNRRVDPDAFDFSEYIGLVQYQGS